MTDLEMSALTLYNGLLVLIGREVPLDNIDYGKIRGIALREAALLRDDCRKVEEAVKASNTRFS